MKRRAFMIGLAAVSAGALLPPGAQADVPKAYSWDASPPTSNRDAFIKWMVENRGENPKILAARWDRYLFLKANTDFKTVSDPSSARGGRAFLLTPRDEFVLKRDVGRAYERDFHDIGFGVTISGPLVVSRMTSTVDVQFGEKVLEVGTGSGYQSAYLANLTDKVWSIEIIKPLAERTRGIHDGADRARLYRVQGDHVEERRRLLRLGRSGALRQDHGDVRHRPHPAAAAAAAQAERHHGDPGRPARPARDSQDREAAEPGRLDPGRALERLQQGGSVRAVHQAGRRQGQGHARLDTRPTRTAASAKEHVAILIS